MYCTQSEDLQKLMIPICEVDGFMLYLYRNQSYPGRSILAYSSHICRVSEMDSETAGRFFLAAQKAAKAIEFVYGPKQVNFGMFGDSLCHCHIHIVPKYEGGLDFGGMFQMNPQPQALLIDQEYDEKIAAIRTALSD